MPDPTGGYTYLLGQGVLGVACFFLILALIYLVRRNEALSQQLIACTERAKEDVKEILAKQGEIHAVTREVIQGNTETNRTMMATSTAIAEAVKANTHELALLRTQSDTRDRMEDLRRSNEARA